MEQSSVNQRLNSIVDTFERGKKAAFARKAGISPQGAQELLAGRKGDPSFKVLVKILESYPQVRMEWLILGDGQMLREGMVVEEENRPQVFVSNSPSDTEYIKKVQQNMQKQTEKSDREIAQIWNALKILATELPQNEVTRVLKDLMPVYSPNEVEGDKSDTE